MPSWTSFGDMMAHNTKRVLLCGMALVGCGLVLFLALRGSPHLRELPWMPDWLGAWADRHGRLRNLPAFAGLAVLLFPFAGIFRGACLAGGLAVVVECVQIALPGRIFDWADIFWSLVGVAAAALLVAAVGALARAMRSSAKSSS